MAVAPGLTLCVGVTLLATLLQALETRVAGQPYLEALVLAILLGVAVRTVLTPGPRLRPGIEFSAKFLLEVAVMLLGASVSVHAVAALGPALLAGIVVVVAVAIGASYGISRLFRLPWRMALLIACGNSAIAAVAPVIAADADDIASSIAFTAVLGVIVVLLLPLLVPLLHMSLTWYGVLAGLTVYAVPQVLAATLPIGALSNQNGTVVKLVRVLMLGPVVLAVSLFSAELAGVASETGCSSCIGCQPRVTNDTGRPSRAGSQQKVLFGLIIDEQLGECSAKAVTGGNTLLLADDL